MGPLSIGSIDGIFRETLMAKYTSQPDKVVTKRSNDFLIKMTLPLVLR